MSSNTLLGIIPLYGLVDAFVLIFGEARQCVHDKIRGYDCPSRLE